MKYLLPVVMLVVCGENSYGKIFGWCCDKKEWELPKDNEGYLMSLLGENPNYKKFKAEDFPSETFKSSWKEGWDNLVYKIQGKKNEFIS